MVTGGRNSVQPKENLKSYISAHETCDPHSTARAGVQVSADGGRTGGEEKLPEAACMGHCDGTDCRKVGVLGRPVFPKRLCAEVLTPSISDCGLTWKQDFGRCN